MHYDIVAWNKLYRTDLFRAKKIQYPAGEIHEDTLTTYKLYAEAHQVTCLARPLYFYRHRRGSIMDQTSALQIPLAKERAAHEAIIYFSANSTKNPELLAAAEVSLLLAKFAYLDASLRGDISEKYFTETLPWIRAHASDFQDNPAMTRKLRVYLRLIKTPNALGYKLFRRLKRP